MKGDGIGILAFCLILSLALTAMAMESHYGLFRESMIRDLLWTDSWIVISPIFATLNGFLVTRSSYGEYQRRVALSGLFLSSALLWILSSSPYIVMVVMFSPVAAFFFLWARLSKRGEA